MSPLAMLLAPAAFLLLAGRLYSRHLSRAVGEDALRATPAVLRDDGRDYVPSPTGVVFAHHFASIAGAGPILGPCFALVYGWAPALLWVVIGGVFIGAVHDYLALMMATREGGVSIATVARRMLGRGPFLALVVFLVLLLVLVCATFLNASAAALTSMLPFRELGLSRDQTLFRVVGEGDAARVVIGGVASMSVIVITAFGPLLGWLYLKRKVSVAWCSLLALGICAVSIAVGLLRPVALPDDFLGTGLAGADAWRLILAAYVLVAAGLPVWFFLQSRDFINVHLLYAGLAALVVTLLVAGVKGVGPPEGALPAFNVAQGNASKFGWIWPGLFITIACGAVSGFHSLCAGGTTTKQIRSEPAARRVGYGAMQLETFLAVCVIAALVLGLGKDRYLLHVHPDLLGRDAGANVILGFALSVGGAMHRAFGIPEAGGALAGMILLEGFLVTTLDTAVRLTRYLIEEIWRALFGRYDLFAAEGPAAAPPVPTSGPLRALLSLLRHYWANSGIAVALMLLFAFTGGQKALWGIFGTSNQLLAAIVLSIASLWLLAAGRRIWFALIPAVLMLATTAAALVLWMLRYLASPAENLPLLVADGLILGISVYLFAAGGRVAARRIRGLRQPA